MSKIISLQQLQNVISDAMKAGALVAAPVDAGDDRWFYEYISDPNALKISGDLKPKNTIKEFFFPRHELICSFRRKENDVELNDAPVFDKDQIIIGARPCETASLPILDPLFAWDYQDRFYQTRRERSTIVSVACVKEDRHCFCSALGGAPDMPGGSDVMLYCVDENTFEVRCLTDKGKKLFDGKTADSDKTGQCCSLPDKKYDLAKIQTWLDANFTSPIWAEQSKRCVGCGVCTYLCPTCHCFDIIDEGSFQKGTRVKNWDSCQMTLFTLHASGHNPRASQDQRQRQRITHKFAIYPDKFGKTLCTGCGNCTRDCPGGLGVRPFLDLIEKELDK